MVIITTIIIALLLYTILLPVLLPSFLLLSISLLFYYWPMSWEESSKSMGLVFFGDLRSRNQQISWENPRFTAGWDRGSIEQGVSTLNI